MSSAIARVEIRQEADSSYSLRMPDDSDSSKIASGTDWSACRGFQFVCVPTNEDVKRSG